MNNNTNEQFNVPPKLMKGPSKSQPCQKKTRENQLIYLSKVTAFTQLKNYQIDYIYRVMKTVEYPRGYILFLEGQKCETIYVIKQGEVELYKKEPIIQEEDQLFLLNQQKYVYQLLKILGEKTAFGEADIQGGTHTFNARVSTHTAEFYAIKVIDYKRILDMEPQIKQQQFELENLESFEGVTKFQLPSLFESVKSSQAKVEEIQYEKKEIHGQTYLIPKVGGSDIMKNSHFDTTLNEIHNKSIHIYKKRQSNYKQIDLSNPLIKQLKISNDKFQLLRFIQNKYTFKINQSPLKIPKLIEPQLNLSNVERRAKRLFKSTKYGHQSTQSTENTHREKMKIIQDCTPRSQSYRSTTLNQDSNRQNLQNVQLFDIQDPIRQKQFIPTELFPIYCHLVKPDVQENV